MGDDEVETRMYGDDDENSTHDQNWVSQLLNLGTVVVYFRPGGYVKSPT